MFIKPVFESIFLINGKLSEDGRIVFGINEVVYITVLPLEAVLLPYTVKMVGHRIKSNGDLAACYSLGDGDYYLKLLPRHNFVYNVGDSKKEKAGLSIIEKFFNFVSKGKLALARECLSDDLSYSIDDEDLKAFFDEYTDLVKGENSGEYYLIKKGGKGVLYWFNIVDGVIDNIMQRG